jgi:N-acetylmuramoyl-L-alanine amidase
MPPPFRKVTLDQFAALLRDFPFTRRINEVHMHHTWRPNWAQYQGHETIVGIWRFHTGPENRWRDIAQHLTIAPDGSLWLGRNWNLPPASASGYNGTAAAGPFMFEMIGDFDRGKDPFDGPQKQATLQVIALVQGRFDLPASALRFHNQMSHKTCPGTAISYSDTVRAVQQLRTPGREGVAEAKPWHVEAQAGAEREAGPVLFGDEGEPAGQEDFVLFGDDEETGGMPAGAGTGADVGTAGGAGAISRDTATQIPGQQSVEELILAMLRPDGPLGLAQGESPYAEPVEREGPADTDRRVPLATFAVTRDEEALFGGTPITIDMKESLRPHVINLSRGRFSTSGLYQTAPEDVDAIFGEDLERAVEGRSAANPLRLVIWAHGGLVDEPSGLQIAYKHVRWWNANGVYPLYFVWETGLLEALGRVITGRSGGEEGLFGTLITELTDQGVESLARLLQGPAIWSDMKQSARLAVEPNDGGAHYVGQKLAEFCTRHPGAVELHAVGHSAGAIFHASFLPAAFALGAPPFRSLALLAPAIRVDRFHERLAPQVGPRGSIERVVLFTMNKLRELDDNCIGIYQKSLLYLIYYALEDQRETAILGLEVSLRSDPTLKALFGLGGIAPGAPAPVGEVIWSKTPSNAGPRSRSASTAYGAFDDDPSTMDSLLHRILDRDDIQTLLREPRRYGACGGCGSPRHRRPAA